MKLIIPIIKKEILQILRDPSTIIIAFILPLVAMIIFMYGISLDSVHVIIGLRNDNPNVETASLVDAFNKNEYISTVMFDTESQIATAILKGKIHGAVTIPNDFTRKLARGEAADLLLVTDGGATNTANYVWSYVENISNQWLRYSKYYNQGKALPIVTANVRSWYNPTMNSNHFIIPGSLTITMTLIGILLTALVVAREWERGTMEALLSTRICPIHIVIGKYIPYYFVAIISLLFNFFLAVFIFGVPFRGNFFVLCIVSSLFVFSLLGIGLTISTAYKNQFLASMMAMGVGFFPALMLSGLLFPINSMPIVFQHITRLLPPRYFTTFIESEFLAGTIPSLVFINSVFLIILGIALFANVYHLTPQRLDDK